MNQANQLKKIANFELGKEVEFNRLSIYDFLFHLQALHDDQQEAQ